MFNSYTTNQAKIGPEKPGIHPTWSCDICDQVLPTTQYVPIDGSPTGVLNELNCDMASGCYPLVMMLAVCELEKGHRHRGFACK